MSSNHAGEQTVALLRRRVAEPAFRDAYRAKIVQVPGSGCWWWTGAVSGRGHGRVFLGRDDAGRGHTVIAHRLGYALEHGVDALLAATVLGHRCDNPLCQRIAPGHVTVSSHAGNRREYLARRILADTPLDDPQGSLHRALRARARLRAHQDLEPPSGARQPTLWDDPTF